MLHGRHFVRYLGICNPICVKLLLVMAGVISSNLNQKRRLHLKPFSWGPQTRHTHSDTQTQTHTHDDSIRRNAMRCISFKNVSVSLQTHTLPVLSLHLPLPSASLPQPFLFPLTPYRTCYLRHSFYIPMPSWPLTPPPPRPFSVSCHPRLPLPDSPTIPFPSLQSTSIRTRPDLLYPLAPTVCRSHPLYSPHSNLLVIPSSFHGRSIFVNVMPTLRLVHISCTCLLFELFPRTSTLHPHLMPD